MRAGLVIISLLALASTACDPVPAPTTNPGPRDTARHQAIREFWNLIRSANAHRIAGRCPEAIVAYQAALAIDPEHEDSFYSMANCQIEIRQTKTAATTLEDLLDLNPRSARGHLQRGWLAIAPELGQLDPVVARHHFDAAHAINKEETGALLGLAECDLHQGRFADARRRAEMVLRTDTGSQPASVIRAFIRWRDGDQAGALEDLGRQAGDSKPPTDVPGEGDTLTHSASDGATAKGRRLGLVAKAIDQGLVGAVDPNLAQRLFAELEHGLSQGDLESR